MLRHERKRQGLTQEQLAAIAGVGIRFVRELEAGKTTCQLGLALHVMRTLVDKIQRDTSHPILKGECVPNFKQKAGHPNAAT